MKREKLVFLILAGGFLTTFLEVRYLHQDVLSEEWVGWVPVLLTPVLVVASLLALSPARALRAFAMAALAIGAVAGVAGFYFHSDGLELSHMSPYFTARVSEPGTIVARADGDDEEEGGYTDTRRKKRTDEPPLFAPLGITGLALIGLALSAKRERPDSAL
ncbi:MAG TPA: hypothetical protein VGE01_12910 [Fimbriimonas sp.]